MTSALDYMVARAHDHRARYRWHLIERDEAMPTAAEVGEPIMIGGYVTKTMGHDPRAWARVGSFATIGDTEDMPGRLARYYLDYKFPAPLVRLRGQIEACKARTLPAPLHAVPGEYDFLMYVDITSTYFSIINKWGWDVDYWPGEFLVSKTPASDFPLATTPGSAAKSARASLVSCARQGHIRVERPNGSISDPIPVRSIHINDPLLCFVSHVLNLLALRAVQSGAVYVHTDGYAFRDEDAASDMMSYIEAIGLVPREVARGSGYVAGPGSYKIGKRKTVRRTGDIRRPFEARRKEELEWLEKRLLK